MTPFIHPTAATFGCFLLLEDSLTPLNPIVDALVCRLDDNLRDLFGELAGVMQFEVGKERELAEALALLDVVRMTPLAVAGAVVLRATVAGNPVLAVTADRPAAEARLGTLGATGVALGSLPTAVASLGGTARLRRL